MKIQLDRINDVIVFLAMLEINASLEDVWHCISTTEGYAKWFAEIELRDDFDALEIVYNDAHYEEVLQIIEYRILFSIAYTWLDATVSFTIESSDDGVHLIFEENIPVFSPVLSQDITRWHGKLNSLKAVCEHSDFPPYDFHNQQSIYEARLKALL